ncbi:MAG TPA: helix-turn-helix domain-containing protein [Chloroflexota bacterium]
MTPGERNPLTDLARLLPDALDDDALKDLASRLLPYLETPRSPEPHDPLLTAADAAGRVGVNVETVRRAIRAGELTVAARIGRSPRITEVALQSWLDDTSQNHRQATTIRQRRPRRVNRPAENSLRAAFDS